MRAKLTIVGELKSREVGRAKVARDERGCGTPGGGRRTSFGRLETEEGVGREVTQLDIGHFGVAKKEDECQEARSTLENGKGGVER